MYPDTLSSTVSITPKHSVLVVDDHPIIRHGVCQTLGLEPDLQVVAEASSATEALDALRTFSADLAVIDVSLNGTNGIELIKQIRNEHPRLPILVLSMHDESLYALRAVRAGAGGYIMKREAPDLLLTAVRKVLGGEVYLSPALERRARPAEEPAAAANPIDALSDRELEVLDLVGQGHHTRDIAQRLDLSSKTIETHRLNMKDKLGLKTAPELIRYAVNWVRSQAH
jgi:DNA-binding NarL/FixJ family response regulator